MFIGAATALTVGVVIALFNPTWAVFTARLPFVLGGATAAACFLFGAILCVRAIQPVNFFLPGCEPEAWEDDVSSGRKLDCYGDRAKHIQEMIVDNSKTIGGNAKLFKWGTRLGIAAPFAGLLMWGLHTALSLICGSGAISS